MSALRNLRDDLLDEVGLVQATLGWFVAGLVAIQRTPDVPLRSEAFWAIAAVQLLMLIRAVKRRRAMRRMIEQVLAEIVGRAAFGENARN